jgi:hypothetical protein
MSTKKAWDTAFDTDVNQRPFSLTRDDSDYSIAHPVDLENVDFRKEAWKATQEEERRTRSNRLARENASRTVTAKTVPRGTKPTVLPKGRYVVIPRGNIPEMFRALATKKAGRGLRRTHTKNGRKKPIKRNRSHKQNK